MTTAETEASPSANADTQGIFEALLHAYANANNAGDSLAYSRLFTADAIWMPPGAEPEYGPEQIRTSVQPYFDDATWSARFTPVDALRVAEGWTYGIADVDVTTTAHGDGTRSSFGLTATWLLQRQASGEWLIARQMWNPQSRDVTNAYRLRDPPGNGPRGNVQGPRCPTRALPRRRLHLHGTRRCRAQGRSGM